jgi:hypothetical protein
MSQPRTKLSQRPVLDDVIRFPITAAEKAKIFELAAKRRVSASEFIRAAIVRGEPELAA